jgi:hypothetical protein
MNATMFISLMPYAITYNEIVMNAKLQFERPISSEPVIPAESKA